MPRQLAVTSLPVDGVSTVTGPSLVRAQSLRLLLVMLE
jgi:hypothetical protein